VTPLRRAAHKTFSSMKSRNLRLLLAGLAITQVGNWVRLTALPWVVLGFTDNGAVLGAAVAMQFVPILLVGAWAGVVTDRSDTRRLLLVTTSLVGLTVTALGIMTLLGAVALWSVVLLVFAQGVVNAFDGPARRSFIPELVEPSEMPNAISLSNAVFTSARIIGPSIAGVVIATVGVGWCFVLTGLSSLGALTSLTRMKTADMRVVPPLPRAKGQLREGIRYVWNQRLVRLAILMAFSVGVFASNLAVVLPLLTKRTFHAGPTAYALMSVAMGVGALIGALASAHRSKASGRVMVVGSIAMGGALGAAAAAPHLVFALLALGAVGMLQMTFFSSAMSIVQARSDPALLGRATALFSVAFVGSIPVGSPIVGAIAESLGPRAGLVVGAIGTLATGLVGGAALRRWSGRGARERIRENQEPLWARAG
jgi:MFS family permease